MRQAFLICIALAAACAAPVARTVVAPRPVVAAPIVLAGGPEGESPLPSPAPVAPAAVTRPALATAAMVPSAHIAAAITKLRDKQLMIPVVGVSASEIEDSFTEGRDGGERQHNALDILAPRNTQIVSADDGVILRMSTNTLGGITIYAADRDKDFVYYYAHLDHYEKHLEAGKSIHKGDVLGYVGTTGNAPKDVPHLHFQIMLWATDGKYWNGEPVNPYPILHDTGVTPP